MNVNTNISMEYEARVMINEEQYLNIKKIYLAKNRPIRFITNKNIYLDTPDIYLINHHMVLRVREINKKDRELTLKVKGEKGDIEITEKIINDKQYQLILSGTIFSKDILNELLTRNIDVINIKVITTLLTERIEIPYKKYLLVIDKNYYNDKIDYNIEVEANSKKEAKKYLKKIIEPFGIIYKKGYISKSHRAINDYIKNNK